MQLHLSKKIKKKLESRAISTNELFQCFFNREMPYVEDDREEHRTDPPTKAFIAQTDRGRSLKIAFVPREGVAYIKSAFEPTAKQLKDYEDKCNE